MVCGGFLENDFERVLLMSSHRSIKGEGIESEESPLSESACVGSVTGCEAEAEAEKEGTGGRGGAFSLFVDVDDWLESSVRGGGGGSGAGSVGIGNSFLMIWRASGQPSPVLCLSVRT